ncbi:UDP-glucose 4-epimerase family protein [Thiohalomonas denitrificans]|uniref:Nucleoside-diphosphate-sugar epimerase n=1 Tax=Thiohalomonas denitrificans TaxID=415747 RepID=A0A1G5R050_9GAMM|nr:SDR family oxidoreductase [Thiohalomonas denitrificans]SCZ67218.1 Nucleoside-diphosphate-sugar epimerase [Thiohalomonas denitrificans]
MSTVLVTGATGFLGGSVLRKLTAEGKPAVVAVRSSTAVLSAEVPMVQVGDLTPEANWREALNEVDVVVHAAARVHVMHETATDALAVFREVNVEGTLNLARQAADAGVRRLVFISSIKVNGEQTAPGQVFGADDKPLPQDPYGVSKWEAEERLMELADESGMEVVCIRPSLVYGPGVKANFLSMMRWVAKGVPLPLGAIHNQRSLVALDNLVDLIITCIDHPAAANQTFLAGDGEDLSTTELLRRLGDALGKPARLLPVPVWVLEAGAAMVGKQAVARRLCGSLQVDISKARDVLGWTPPVSVDEALRETAREFKSKQRC